MKAASLRVRVTSWYGGLLTAALLIFGSAVYLGLRNYLFTTLQRTLRDESANIVEEFVANADNKGTEWLAGEVEESYAPESDGRYIRILREGHVLYQSRNVQADFLSRIPPQPSSAPGRGSFVRVIAGSAGPLLLYTTSWVSPSGVHFVVQTGAPTAPIDRTLRSLLIALSLLTPVIIAGAAIGGYLLMSVPFRPVVALTRHAEQIGTRALGERLPVIATGDELERLSISLNRMIDRLEESLAHNRRFSADVSHELRTPLTILRGELEPLVSAPGLPATVQDAIGSALEEIERMSDIVENLLTISKLDFSSAIPRSLVDLSAVARSTVEQMQLLADDKHLAVYATAAGETWVCGDRVRIQQVIVNLLDNAIKYTPAGGAIWLEVSPQRNMGLIEVRDNGIGIPAECLPFVFDRFYRADKARSRESGGTGLGLSIVKAICMVHEGTVSIQSTEGAGTIVRVDLPLCSPEQIAEERRRMAAAAVTADRVGSVSTARLGNDRDPASDAGQHAIATRDGIR